MAPLAPVELVVVAQVPAEPPEAVQQVLLDSPAAAGWVLPVEQASAVAQVFVEPVPAVVLQVVPVELEPAAGLELAVGLEPAAGLELAVELEPAGLVFVVDVQMDFPASPAEQVQAVGIEQAVVAESLVVEQPAAELQLADQMVPAAVDSPGLGPVVEQ